MGSSAANGLYQIEILGPSGPYRTRNRMTIAAVTGEPVAELSLAPVPLVSRAMSALRQAPTASLEFRLDAIARAGDAFLHGEVAGLSAQEYQHLVARISGLGIAEVRSAAGKIATSAAHAWEWAQFARPVRVIASPQDPAAYDGAALWVRRGDIFAVHAAGNHPAIHGAWLQALALGYRVAVRPSRREPLTPHRLISALRHAGFANNQILLLPTDYEAADEMIRASDLAMVYGGNDVVDKYRGVQLLPRGPGRSKILVTADVDWHDHVELVVDSASRGGGTGCTNVTSILVEGDLSVATAFAKAVAERLARIPSLPPEDENALLPVRSLCDARAIEMLLQESARGTTPILGGDGIVDELGDGSAALRPAVRVVETAEGLQTSGVELAFPCLWFAPWTQKDGAAPLRNTLNLVIIGGNAQLIDAALDDRSIRNVYIGAVPSYFSAPHMPHDGYLSEFLMKAKGFVLASNAPQPVSANMTGATILVENHAVDLDSPRR